MIYQNTMVQKNAKKTKDWKLGYLKKTGKKRKGKRK